MKFLCPQCKAKYKIADEKVASRANPRMKCRKCGWVIDIRSAADAGGDSDRPEPIEPDEAPAPPTVPRRGGIPRPPSARSAATATPSPAPRVATPSPASALMSPAAPRPDAAGFDDDAPTVIKDIATLSAAFSDAVRGGVPDSEERISLVEEWFAGISGSPVGPLSREALRGKIREREVDEETLVWKEGFEDWKPLGSFPELMAVVDEVKALPPRPAAGMPAPASNGGAQQSLPASTTLGRASSPGVLEAPPIDLSDISEDFPFKKRRRGHSPAAAWIAIVVALLFGVTLAVVFMPKETKEIVKIVKVPTETEKAKAEDLDKGDEPADPGTTDLDETDVQGGETKSGKTGVKAASTRAKPEEKKGGLLSGLSGLKTDGPKGPATGTGSSGTSGGQLDGTSIQRTVRNYSASVKRSCWQPALDTRSKNAPSSARVGVTVTIAPSGSVQNVSTTGDPAGYRNLARCIETKVRGWKFPRSSGTTTANIPFVFAAQ